MTDSGLSTRLRQQSRRAGLMVGITMVLAIAICIFGAAGLFAWLSQPFSDLIPVVAPAAQLQPTSEAGEPAGGQPAVDQPAAGDPVIDVQTEATESASAAPTVSSNTEAFEPTHQIAPGDSINFRAGPSVGDAIIVALSPASPLEYLEEDAPTTNSSDGQRWMRFRNENGDEGWIREIDTEPYQP